jgi:hypothetical protein
MSELFTGLSVQCRTMRYAALNYFFALLINHVTRLALVWTQPGDSLVLAQPRWCTTGHTSANRVATRRGIRNVLHSSSYRKFYFQSLFRTHIGAPQPP